MYNLKEFFKGLNRYPACTAAVSVLLALGATKYFLIAFLLCLWVYVLPSVLRKISFFICLIILTLYFFENNNFSFAEFIPQSGFGYVEDVLSRPDGYAVILQTDFGKTRLTYAKENPPLPGDSIFWQAKWFSVQTKTTPGSFDAAKWMQAEGYRASGSLNSVKIISSHFSFKRFSFLIKQKLEHKFLKFYKKPETALLMGLLAGDRSKISETLQNDFRKTGLVHVLSISGFHVVMLAGMLTLFLRALRLPHFVSGVLSICLLCVYAPITGGSAAVWRAVIMFCVIECSRIFQKNTASINALGVALILILLFDPNQAFNLGFQLSAAATYGILLGQKIKLPKFKGKIAGVFSYLILEPSFITFCATLSTLPLLIFHFQTFSPISWFGNLIVVPLVGLGMQAGVFSLFGILPFISQTFADSATLLLRLGSFFTSFLADSSYASVTIGPLPLAVLFAISILIATMPFIKQPNPWAKRIVVFCLFFCSCFFVGTEIKKNFFSSWSVMFLDVGQGDSILLQSISNRNYLIDTGPPQKKRSLARDRIIPYFRSQGVSKIDALIITHPHSDHYGNVIDILKEIPVKEFWTSSCAQKDESKEWLDILKTTKEKGIQIKNLHKGLSLKEEMLLTKDVWSITVLYPDSLTCEKNQNNNSIVLKADGLGQTLLLTGDLEKKKEETLLNLPLKSNVMKIGHHGSKTASSRKFLEKVKPEIAIISVAKKNFYKHPSEETLERLDSLGIKNYRTSERGSIKIEFTKKGYNLF